MNVNTTTNRNNPQLKVYEDPYLKLRVDVRNTANVIHEDLNGWTQSGTAFLTLNNAGRTFIGHNQQGVSGTLTKNIYFPNDGYYLIDIYTLYNYVDNQTFQLYDNGVAVEDTKSCYDTYYHVAWTQYRPRWYSKGTHTMSIFCANWGWIADFVVTPLIRYEGDSLGNKYTTDQGFNIQTCEFTKNSVSEMNQLTLTTEMQENYWNYNTAMPKPVVFDFLDHLTLWLGEDYKSTKVMFGGYSFPSSISPDGKLELKAVDRMYDLQRFPLSSNTQTIGSGGFPNVYELVRYLGNSINYRLNTYGVPADYAFYHSFITSTDFSSVTIGGGWTATNDTAIGNPAPSMKLVGNGAAATAQIFLNLANPYDAKSYDKLSFTYYYDSGTTAPQPFNVHIKMYLTGQTSASAAEYKIVFTGGTGGGEATPTTLGSVTSGTGGHWNAFNVNLKSLFDTLNLNSVNYYVTDIHLSAPSTSGTAMWVDQFMAYRDLVSSPSYTATDLSNKYDILKDVCDKTGHSAYIMPGEARVDDQIVVIPQNLITTAEVSESNLIEFSGWTSDPLGDDLVNSYTGTFTDAGGTAQTVSSTDWASIWKYGICASIDGIDSKTIAEGNTFVSDYVAEHGYPIYGFNLKCRGLAEIVPLQYLTVDLPQWNIFGDFPTKSTIYNYDNNASPKLTTDIDFNRPSRRFRTWVRKTKSTVGLLNNRSKNLGLYTLGA